MLFRSENCVKSTGILSKETIVKAHPWVDDPTKELERLQKEEQAAVSTDPYRTAFLQNAEGGDPLETAGNNTP